MSRPASLHVARNQRVFDSVIVVTDRVVLDQQLQDTIYQFEHILDVLQHYTTYVTYYKLLKACEDDPNGERKKAARALARFMKLHPHNIAQKTEVMVEHFQTVSRDGLGVHPRRMTGRKSGNRNNPMQRAD